MAGGLQQRLRLRDVLVALRQRAVVGRVVGRVKVVADAALPGQRLLDHLRAVDHQPERLAHAHVAEGRLVDPHRERLPGAALRDQRLEARVALDRGQLRRRQVVDRLDLAREQRVEPCGVVGEVDDRHRVDDRRSVPVVGVAHEHALLSRREALVLERAGPDRGLRVVADRHDAVEVLADVVGEADVRGRQRDLHRARVERLGLADVDVADRRGAGARLLRVEDPPQREDDVLGGHLLAVVERDARPQLDGPHVRDLARRDRLGHACTRS